MNLFYLDLVVEARYGEHHMQSGGPNDNWPDSCLKIGLNQA